MAGDADVVPESSGTVGPENAPKDLRRRHCTDCPCVILFVACMLGVVLLLWLGVKYGEPWSLVYGKDYLGNRCGRGQFTNRSKTIYPRIDQDVLEQSAIASTAPWKLVFYGLCVENCPNVSDPAECFAHPQRCVVRDYGTPEQYRAAGGQARYYSVLPTLDVLNRCVPTKYTQQRGPPDRCAFPQCEPNSSSMRCDPAQPALWYIDTFADRRRCDVVFQHVEVRLNHEPPIMSPQ